MGTDKWDAGTIASIVGAFAAVPGAIILLGQTVLGRRKSMPEITFSPGLLAHAELGRFLIAEIDIGTLPDQTITIDELEFLPSRHFVAALGRRDSMGDELPVIGVSNRLPLRNWKAGPHGTVVKAYVRLNDGASMPDEELNLTLARISQGACRFRVRVKMTSRAWLFWRRAVTVRPHGAPPLRLIRRMADRLYWPFS